MLRAVGSASCDMTHAGQAATICNGHWGLPLVISHTKQGVRFVTGLGFCVLGYLRRGTGYDFLRALGSASCDITQAGQGIRFVTGIEFCIL